MKKHILLTCVSLLVSLLSISASIEVRSTHMTTTDGLANNSICYIFQDSKGFIWMGTLNGLSRYDGNSLSLSSRKANPVTTGSPCRPITLEPSARIRMVSCG